MWPSTSPPSSLLPSSPPSVSRTIAELDIDSQNREATTSVRQAGLKRPDDANLIYLVNKKI